MQSVQGFSQGSQSFVYLGAIFVNFVVNFIDLEMLLRDSKQLRVYIAVLV